MDRLKPLHFRTNFPIHSLLFFPPKTKIAIDENAIANFQNPAPLEHGSWRLCSASSQFGIRILFDLLLREAISRSHTHSRVHAHSRSKENPVSKVVEVELRWNMAGTKMAKEMGEVNVVIYGIRPVFYARTHVSATLTCRMCETRNLVEGRSKRNEIKGLNVGGKLTYEIVQNLWIQDGIFQGKQKCKFKNVPYRNIVWNVCLLLK